MAGTTSWRGVAAVLVVAAVTLGACSGDAQEDAFPEDISSWSLPLDQYYPDMQRISYGHLLTVQSCAAEKGVHHRIWSYDESGTPPVNRGEFGDWIMTVENPEEWGYLAAPDTRLDPADQRIEEEFQFTDEEQEVWTACIHSARAELGDVGEEVNLVETLANEALWRAREDPSVTSTEAGWSACMKKVGVPGTPEDPYDMPGVVLAEDAVLPAGMDARAVAVEDAKCQDSSGYLEALYRAQIQAQTDVIEEYSERLEATAEHIAAREANVEKVLRGEE